MIVTTVIVVTLLFAVLLIEELLSCGKRSEIYLRYKNFFIFGINGVFTQYVATIIMIL